jgi:hypothetical protein
MSRRDEDVWRVTTGTKTYWLHIKWTVSRARDSYGYNVCTLYVDGDKAARCNGGGYDMRGTVVGDWIARTFPDKLRQLTKEFYGLSFHDPNFDPGKAIPDPNDGRTVEQREKDGVTVGLERYQSFYRASSKLPTERHTVPLLDGAYGLESMLEIAQAIGLQFERGDL